MTRGQLALCATWDLLRQRYKCRPGKEGFPAELCTGLVRHMPQPIAGYHEAHREVLALFQSYAANGDDVQIKAFAMKTVPVLQAHLDMAEKLQAQQVGLSGFLSAGRC